MLERRQVRLPVGLYALQLVDGQPCRSFVTSLSENGCLLDTPALPKYRRSLRVQIEVTLPGQTEALWIAGEVVHDASGALFNETAVRFTGMANAHRSLLRAWLRVQYLEEAAASSTLPSSLMPNAA